MLAILVGIAVAMLGAALALLFNWLSTPRWMTKRRIYLALAVILPLWCLSTISATVLRTDNPAHRAPTQTDRGSSLPATTEPAVNTATSAGACPSERALATTVSESENSVRRTGKMTLPPRYGGDLDSACADWTVRSSLLSIHDLANDGTGLVARNANVDLAPIPKGVEATYEHCAANTDSRPGAIPYSKLRVGDRFCALTSDGRRSALTVTRLERLSSLGYSIQLSVQTWTPTQVDPNEDDYSWVLALLVIFVLLGGGSGAVAKSRRRPVKVDVATNTEWIAEQAGLTRKRRRRTKPPHLSL